MKTAFTNDSSAKRAESQAPAASRPAVVLVRPREEGNVGAVARAMANMGLGELLLVEPAPRLGGVARGFGVGGWHVLDAAHRVLSLRQAVAPFRRVVGTSAGRLRCLGRTRVLPPRELAPMIRGAPTALVFGPEDRGLTREELDLCNLVVQIPCAPEHPTLNLAQAVVIVAYELFLAAGPGIRRPEEPPATAAELEGLLAAAGELLERVGFDHPHIHRALLRDVRRLTGRSGASSHEVRVLWRIVNRILRRL